MGIKNTGFTTGWAKESLFVGDIVAFYSGFQGYFEIKEKDNEFWVVDCSQIIFNCELASEEMLPPFKLESDLDGNWTKVDKANPTKEPLQAMNCDKCNAVIGGFDVDTGESTWYENCSSHEEHESIYNGIVISCLCINCK